MTNHTDLEFVAHELVTIDGRPMWRFSDGTLLPYIAGGEGPVDDGDDGGDPPGDDGEGGDGEDGESDDGDSGDVDELAAARAEAAKWKRQARKHEKRAKENKAALDRIASQNDGGGGDAMSAEDADRIREEARSAAMRDIAERSIEVYLDAQVEAGRLEGDQVEVLLDSIDPSKFIDDEGDVDTDKVKNLIQGIAKPAKGAKGGTGTSGSADTGQGRRQGASSRRGKTTGSVADGRELYREMHGGKKHSAATA